MASEAATSLPKRSELTEEQRWNLESVFPSIEAWEVAREHAEALIDQIPQFSGRLGESAETLLHAFEAREEVMNAVSLLAVYAGLRESEDATNSTFVALDNRAMAVVGKAMAAGAYFEPELLALPAETIEQFVNQEPELAKYNHFFDKVNRKRPYTRSAEVEAVLAQSQDVTGTFGSVRSALENADLDLGTVNVDGRAVQIAQGNLGGLLQHPDRETRKAVWTSAADAYVSMRHTFAASYSGAVKREIFYARAHNFDTAVEASLFRQELPREVYDNLLDTIWKNLPTWHRYFAIRKRILGLDEQHEWDITAPLSTESRKIPYQDGVQIILDTLAPLGEEYVETVRQGIADRWVDPYANIGKHGGAFSSGTRGTFPFISMSYTDDFESVSTLAHELGHSMHSYNTWQTQPVIYSRYGMMVGETASNMHQALMGKKLLNEVTDPAYLLEIVEERMGNHLRYFFTMPILAKFELACHTEIENGGALTADSMTERLADIYEEAYGGEVVVDRERMGITWARFPHLYSPFYVFNYALGIAAAAALSQQVLDEGEPAAQRYINEFLRAGASKYQLDALLDAGVDMRDPAPIQAAFDTLASYVDKLDELTK